MILHGRTGPKHRKEQEHDQIGISSKQGSSMFTRKQAVGIGGFGVCLPTPATEYVLRIWKC